MRKLLAVVAVVMAAVIGFGVSTLRTVVKREVDAYVARIEKGTQREVTIGNTGIGFAPLPVIRLTNVRIQEKHPERRKQGPLLETPSVRIRPQLTSLLAGRARIKSVEVESPVVNVVRFPGGGRNIGAWILGRDDEEGWNLELPVRVSDAQISYTDLEDPDDIQRLDITEVSFDLEPTAADGRTAFRLTAVPPGEGAAFRAEGTFKPTGLVTHGTELDFDYELTNFDASAARHIIPKIRSVEINGPLSLSGKISGFYGGERTEIEPAEKLDITAVGSAMLGVLGIDAPVKLNMHLSDKERRLRFDKAELEWRGATALLTGWTRYAHDQPVSFKLDFKNFDSDVVLRDYGLTDRWRPRTVVEGQIRMEGTFQKPLLRYTASADGLKMDFYEGYAVEAGPLEAKGIIFSVGADFSAVVTTEYLKIGEMRLDNATFGSRYHRDSLTLTAVDEAVWDGKGTIGAHYEPTKTSTMEASALLDDLDAAAAFAGLFPGFEPKVEGRVDAIVQLGGDENSSWAMGRIGLYRGRYPGFNIGAAVIGAIAEEPGMAGLMSPEMRTMFKQTLTSPDTHFAAVKFDFKSQPDGYAIGRVEMRVDGLAMYGHGSADAEGAIDVRLDVSPTQRFFDKAVADVPDLKRLAAADGKVHIPVRLFGKLDSLAAKVDAPFLVAARRAVAGRFITLPPPLAHEPPLEIDLPELMDHYGR